MGGKDRPLEDGISLSPGARGRRKNLSEIGWHIGIWPLCKLYRRIVMREGNREGWGWERREKRREAWKKSFGS